MISIAHNGQELGQFSEDEVVAMVENGQIDQTAHYWMEGMTEWRPITEIIQTEPLPPPPPTLPPLKRREAEEPNRRHVNYLIKRGFPTTGMSKKEVQDLFEATKAEEERRANEITDRQRVFLDYHGIKYTLKTTKTEASELISNADFPDSQWNSFKHLIHPDLYEKPQFSLSANDDLREAKERLASAQEEYKKLKASGDTDSEEDIECAKQEVEDIRAEIEDLKAQIEDDKLAKQEGTDDVSSFVDSWAEGSYEHSGEDVERFKKVVKKPTKTQYKALTEKLAADLGLGITVLSLDQFLCLYVQQFPDALKEPYRSKGFPQLSVQIPKTYLQQLQLEQASSQGSSGSTASAKKGCLGLVLLISPPIGALFVVAVLLLWCLY
jgi:hypothetical protein